MLEYPKFRRRTCTGLDAVSSIWLSELRSILFAYRLCYPVGHFKCLFIGP